MAIPTNYCRLYDICCTNELRYSDCEVQERACEKVDASHQKHCIGRNCTELTTTTTTTAAPEPTSGAVVAAVALPSLLSLLLAAVLSRRL